MGAGFSLIALLLVPFTSVLVRYRVGYSSPTSLWGVSKRVYRILGIKGFTYGLAPTIWLGIILPLFWPQRTPPKIYISASPGVLGFSATSALVYTLVYYIFVLVTVYRAITTTHELDSWKPQEAFHVLFTAHERKRPWAIYQIPGLIPALVLNICINIFVLRLVYETFIFPPTSHDRDLVEEVIRTIINGLFALLCTVVLAPLEVVTTRLAIQRNYGPRVEQQEKEPSDTVEPPDLETNAVSTSSPNLLPLDAIVRVRNEDELYLGLLDCLRRTVDEEGWSALYRGWFFTFLGAFAV